MMLLHMKNGSKEYVSRKYLPYLKSYLGCRLPLFSGSIEVIVEIQDFYRNGCPVNSGHSPLRAAAEKFRT